MTPPPMMAPSNHPSTACGPNCRYRALYEGAQLTLTSMGQRQAEALSRVGRLRADMVKALRHLDPAGFVEAERKAGRRLSDVDDDVLTGYLHAFLAGALAGSGGTGMNELRDALTAAGFVLPAGTDPKAWADAVHSRQSYSPSAAAAVAGAPSTGSTSDFDDLADFFAAADAERAAASQHQPASTTATHADPASSADPAPAVVGESIDDLADLFAGDDPAVRGVEDLADLFGDDDLPTAATPRHTSPELASVDDLADLFSDEPALEVSGDQPAWDLDADSPTWDTPTWDNTETLDEPLPPHSETASHTTNSAPEPEPDADPETSDTAAIASPVVPAQDAPKAKQRTTTKPMRPQMLPLPGQAATLGRRRTGRSTSPLDAAAATAPEVSDDVHKALLAAVSTPRPMFIDDLRAVVPNPVELAAWETRMRAQGDAPVRFIPAKARYRHLGSLVVPRDEVREVLAEFNHSLWNDCITQYRGARLYEMGVLLREYAGSIAGSWLCDDVTVTFRITDGRGMTGIVTFLGPDPRVEDIRDTVLERVQGMLAERLTLLVILATNTEAVPAMRDLILEEAPLRGWAPLMPVALARASDFAQNRGGAELLLGG